MDREHREKRITALAARAAFRMFFKRKVCHHSERSSSTYASEIIETESDISPLDIDLVLNLVFEKLEKKQRLKCRAVDKRWHALMTAKINRLGECTEKNDGTVVLNGSNIGEYVQFVRKVPPGMRNSLLNVSLVIGGTHRYDQLEYDATMQGLRFLVELRGPDCVHSIAVNITRQEVIPDWKQFFCIIKYFGPGLRSLSIHDNTSGSALSKMNVVYLPPPPGESSPHLFPNLLAFTYGVILKNNLFMAQVVNSAPNLEKLLLPVKRLEVRRLTSYAARNEKIRRVLEELNPKMLKNLKELTVPLDQESTYYALKTLTLPNLEKLKLMIRRVVTDEAAQVLASFLKINCPKLNSLEFDFHSNEVDYDQNGFIFPHGSGFPQFPKYLPELPQVKNIGWAADQTTRFATVTRPTGIKLDNFNHWCFPNLNEVTIHAGTFLYLESHFPLPQPNAMVLVDNMEWRDNAAAMNHLTLPTVSRLNFVFDTFPERDLTGLEPRMIDFPEVCSQIHHLLPNLKFVFIDNKVTPLVKHVPILKRMMRVFLMEVTGFETLKISNYFQDWLNEFMDGLSQEAQRVTTGLQGLKTLIFPKIEKSYDDILASGGASIGLRPPELHRASFVELVMARARAQFSPDQHHPWEQEFHNLIAEIQAPTTMIHLHVFMAGEAAELDFDLTDPVLFQLNIGPMTAGLTEAQAGPPGPLVANGNQQPEADMVIVGDMMLDDGTPDNLANQLVGFNFDEPAPVPLTPPTFNQLFLDAIERAANEYPLPEVIPPAPRPFTYTKLDILKYCARLPALKRLCVHESFLRDSVEHDVQDMLQIWSWTHPTLDVELI